jgi:hypothetical protein
MLIEKISSELEELKSRNNQQNGEISSLYEIKNNLELKISDLEKNLSNIKFSLKENEMVLTKTSNEHKLSKEDNNILNEKFEFTKSQLLKLENINKVLNEDNITLIKVVQEKDQLIEKMKEAEYKMFEDNCKLYKELEVIKCQTVKLIEQNKVLIDELEIVNDEDNVIKLQLNQRENLANLLLENKSRIDSSLNYLDERR